MPKPQFQACASVLFALVAALLVNLAAYAVATHIVFEGIPHRTATDHEVLLWHLVACSFFLFFLFVPLCLAYPPTSEPLWKRLACYCPMMAGCYFVIPSPPFGPALLAYTALTAAAWIEFLFLAANQNDRSFSR